MRIVLQRVKRASVKVHEELVGSIDKGYLILLGIAKGDDKQKVEKAVEKISKLRIFADEQDKTNLNAFDVGGEILIVSQFTLLADLSQNRPSFSNAGDAKLAKELYDYFIDCAKSKFVKVQTGRFASHMEVSVINDGPFTLTIEI